MYEVMLEHLLTEEHGGIQMHKVYSEDRFSIAENLPRLLINGQQIDLEQDFNSVMKARDTLTQLLQ